MSTLNARVDYLLQERDIPTNMESCIGSILACKGRFDIPELSEVDTSFAAYS